MEKRKVVVSKFSVESQKAEEVGIATFHEFGSNFEEFDNGAGNFSIAIVEWSNGKVESVPVDFIRFLTLEYPKETPKGKDRFDLMWFETHYDEVKKLLGEVYGSLWVEAFYDPTNESTRQFALPLAKQMVRLNEVMGFRK